MSSPPRVNDFRIHLQNELIRRCNANRRYSLRAFARFLQIEPSALSKILRDQRRITETTFEKLAARMRLSTAEVKRYRATLLRQSLPHAAAFEDADFQQLSTDAFELISGWHHYAILQLMKVEDHRDDVAWFGRALGIKPAEVAAALSRLERLGIVTREPDGRYVRLAKSLSTVVAGDQTTPALRKLQRDFLDKAKDALESVPIEARDHSSVTLAIDPEMLPAAKESIKEFRRAFCRFMTDARQAREVYNLSIAFYPIARRAQQRDEEHYHA